MSDEIHRFLLDALQEMNYNIDDVDDDTPLGPAGVDLESLSIAELAVRVEDRFGARFNDEEAEKLVGMTFGELREAVADRIRSTATAGS